MAINTDDEILQDFLVEAGEILESLGEQLVELEQSPTDKNLLNSVFRGFHTVKGGAGFLNITPLVDICHRAEDVFNTLRQGDRPVAAALMDVVLKVLDRVNGMMAAVRSGQAPEPAGAELLATLEQLAKPSAAGAAIDFVRAGSLLGRRGRNRSRVRCPAATVAAGQRRCGHGRDS